MVGAVGELAPDEEAERQISGCIAEAPVGAYLVYRGRRTSAWGWRESSEARGASKPVLDGFEHAGHLVGEATGRAMSRRSSRGRWSWQS